MATTKLKAPEPLDITDIREQLGFLEVEVFRLKREGAERDRIMSELYERLRVLEEHLVGFQGALEEARAEAKEQEEAGS